MLVATVSGRFAGNVTICWTSGYSPFRTASIPEIADLNVLPHFRRMRVASTLMDAAESLIMVNADVAGIGVGLYADYTAAHLMCLKRGYLPDGRGVAYGGASAQPGTSVRIDDDLALMMTRRLG